MVLKIGKNIGLYTKPLQTQVVSLAFEYDASNLLICNKYLSPFHDDLANFTPTLTIWDMISFGGSNFYTEASFTLTMFQFRPV